MTNLDPNMRPPRGMPDVWRELRRLERLIRSNSSSRTRLANSEVPVGRTLRVLGNVEVVDTEGTVRQVVGPQDDGTYTSKDVNAPPPPSPSLPRVTPGVESVEVSWDGLTVDGSPIPTDFDRVSIRLSTVDGFTADTSTEVASLHAPTSGSTTLFAVADVPVFVRLVMVNTSGVESVQSEQATATPTATVDSAVVDQINTDLHGPGGLDDQLATLDTDLHGPGGVDEQLTGLDTALHGTGGLDDQLATLNTELHGTGGLDERLSSLDNDLHGTGGLDDQLANLNTQLSGPGGVNEQLSGIFPIQTGDLADGAVTGDKTSSLIADKITVGTMSGDRIAANTLLGDRIIANTIQGDRIIANTLSGDRVIANTLSGDRVIANTLSGDRVVANTLDASKIVAGSITTDRMTANSISGDRITANTLDAAKIVAGSITTDRMTANSISGDRITGGTLDAGKIIAGTITTGLMTVGTINGDRITTNTLNANRIVAGSITTDRMTANTITGDRITAGTLDASKIVAGSITTDRMTANTINGDRIIGGTITADKLSATAIDSQTITGAYYRTKASGTRVELGQNPADTTNTTSDELRFYYSTQTVPAARIYGVGLSSVRYETKDNTGEHRFIGGITSDHRVNIDGGFTVGRFSVFNKMKTGTISNGTLGAQSRYTVTHGMGTAPDYIGITPGKVGWSQWSIFSRDSSTFVVEFRDTTGALQNGTSGRFDWFALTAT